MIMIKQIYRKPETSVLCIQQQHMICQSEVKEITGPFDLGGGGNGDGRSRSCDEWDDEDR